MAKVYLADDLRHARRVAFKVLRPELAAAVGIDRFIAEILTTARLQHPNILPLFDSGEADGLLFYVMPFVDGPTLSDRIERERQLPVDEALGIAASVAQALDYAHRQGIVHRDIKPGNILLHDGHPLVADFGIAQLLTNERQRRLTQTGHTVGTPTYMSPEQATGESEIDHRTDIYALGTVLYEMLAGEPPYTGSTPVAVLSQALTKRPEPLSHIRPKVGPVEAIVETALERIPADRFATAAHMSAELEKALDIVRGTSVVRTEALPPAVEARPPSRAKLAIALLLAVAGIAWGVGKWATGAGANAPDSVALAVLPFRALGTGAEDLAPGITLTTQDRLSALRGFNVIGAATSGADALEGLSAPEIAAEVGADYVLRASVEHDGERDRVSVRPELYGRNGARIAAGPIVVSLSDLASIEATIAEEVARALDRTLGAAARARLTPPSQVPRAYEAYLRAASVRGPARIARLREAIALDSTLALAHADLANPPMLRWFRNPTAADSAMFHRHASAALRHGPEYHGGYLWMGLFHRTVTLDADSAIYYLNRARDLAPGNVTVSHFLASVLWLRGQVDSALVEAERGAGLDRLSPSAMSRVARILLWKGSLNEARTRHEEALPFALSRGMDFAIADGPLIELAAGDLDAARARLSRVEPVELRLRTAEFVLTWGSFGWVLDDALFEALCRDEPPREPTQSSLSEYRVACALDESRRGNRVQAEALAEAARTELEATVARRPNDARPRRVLAFAQIILGDTIGALANADTAYASNRSYWDFYPGAANAVAYVRLVALAGDTARLLPVLSAMLEGPSPLTKDWVRIDPAFDGVRNHAEVAELIR